MVPVRQLVTLTVIYKDKESDDNRYTDKDEDKAAKKMLIKLCARHLYSRDQVEQCKLVPAVFRHMMTCLIVMIAQS